MNFFELPNSTLQLIMNFLNANNSKNVILDSFTTIIRLAILSQLPSGTKIGIYKNKIIYYTPDSMQGLYRLLKGDKRSDLHNLFLPIRKSVDWYKTDDIKIQYIFDLAHKGLVKLKDNYHNNAKNPDNSTYLSLNIFDGILTGRQPDLYDSITPERAEVIKKELETSPDNIIHKELKKMWEDNDKNIAYNLLTKICSEDDIDCKTKQIDVLESFLKTKDDLVTKLVSKNTQSL